MLRSQAATLTNLQSTNAVVGTSLTTSQNALTSIYSQAQTFQNALDDRAKHGRCQRACKARRGLSSICLRRTRIPTSDGAYVFGGTNSSVAPMASYSGAPQTATAAAFNTAFGFSQSSSQASSISASSMQSFLSGAFASLFSDAILDQQLVPGVEQHDIGRHCARQTVATSATAYGDAFRQLASAYTSVADLGIDNLKLHDPAGCGQKCPQSNQAAMQGLTRHAGELGFSQSQNHQHEQGAANPKQRRSTIRWASSTARTLTRPPRP